MVMRAWRKNKTRYGKKETYSKIIKDIKSLMTFTPGKVGIK